MDLGSAESNIRNSSPRARKVGRSDLPSLSNFADSVHYFIELRRPDMSTTRHLLVAALVSGKVLGGVFSVLTADAFTFSGRGERELFGLLVFRNNGGVLNPKVRGNNPGEKVREVKGAQMPHELNPLYSWATRDVLGSPSTLTEDYLKSLKESGVICGGGEEEEHYRVELPRRGERI
ncbi:hypothetical protein PIB30_050140 [Stylosanthes scabra]|uniref:Uncharacterized protein n=1 Tax=Stylosanthes scabra TaxID=79078 RepID=A0ABU6WFL5_9FABA|nr:hypothetical protein [Stylosanthes scabra]